MKIIKTDAEAMGKILEGINYQADLAERTLGHKGKNFIIGRGKLFPLLTDDGAILSMNVEHEDETVQLGVDLCRMVGKTVESKVGNATTSAQVIFRAIVAEAYKKLTPKDSFLVNQTDGHLVEEEIIKTAERVIEEVKKNVKPVTTRDEIYAIAKVASKNEKHAQIIADIFSKIGADGVITVEEGAYETEYDIVEGMSINRSLVHPKLANKGEGDKAYAQIDNAYVMVTDAAIESVTQFVPIITQLSQKGVHSMVLVAKSFSGEIIKKCVQNKLEAVFTVIPVTPTDITQKHSFEDVALALGAKMLNADTTNFDSITVEDLGGCEKFTADAKQTLFIKGKGNVSGKVAELKQELNSSPSEYDRERITKRIARLSGGLAVIKAGAASPSEREHLKLKLDDAVLDTKQAMLYGVVKGGGLALYEANLALGDTILSSALIAPYTVLKRNAGGILDVPDTIVDSFAGVKACIEVASSAASKLANLGGSIADKKEKKDEQRD